MANTPLLRQFSAPARLALASIDLCLDKVSQLAGQVDSLTVATVGLRDRSKSLGYLGTVSRAGQSPILKTMGDVEDQDKQVKTRTCHHCHGPTNEPLHHGVPSGMGNCTLAHWSGCPGNKLGDGKSWTACPPPPFSTEKSEYFDAVFNASALPSSVEDAAALLRKSAGFKPSVSSTDSGGDSSDEEELKIRQEELEILRIQTANAEKDRKKAEKAEKKEARRRERSELLEKLKKEKAELLARFGTSSPAGAGASMTASDDLKKKAADHAAKQQQRNAARFNDKQCSGLTMPEIRGLPGMTPQVEQYLASLQTLVPSIAKPPSASTGLGSAYQPPGVLGNPGAVGPLDQPAGHADEIDASYVYVAKIGKLVKVVQDSQVLQQKSAMVVQNDLDTSEDEACTLVPEDGFKFEWKRDEKGRKYFVSVPDERVVTVPIPTYIFDKATGRTYRHDVLPQQQQGTAGSQKVTKKAAAKSVQSQPLFVDHRQAAAAGTTAALSAVDERMPTFLAPESEKQGKDVKIPEMIQKARECPVAWTDKVTSDKLNVVLFSWSYVSSLLAARTGKAPDLEVGELEARLQHLLHVLEITLQTSGQGDYSGDSWNVARLYNQKVQQKVDSKQFSWVQLSTMHHCATLPHELMAATQELAIKPKVKDTARLDRSSLRVGDRERDKKQICASWNRSDVQGKCTYETDNPGQKCKYTHECSWCTSKGLAPATHQRFFCRRKQQTGEE